MVCAFQEYGAVSIKANGLDKLGEERSRADGMVEALGDVENIVRTMSLEVESMANFAKRLSKNLDPNSGLATDVQDGAGRIDPGKCQIEARALEASSRSLQTLFDEVRHGIDFVVHRGQRKTTSHGNQHRGDGGT